MPEDSRGGRSPPPGAPGSFGFPPLPLRPGLLLLLTLALLPGCLLAILQTHWRENERARQAMDGALLAARVAMAEPRASLEAVVGALERLAADGAVAAAETEACQRALGAALGGHRAIAGLFVLDRETLSPCRATGASFPDEFHRGPWRFELASAGELAVARELVPAPGVGAMLMMGVPVVGGGTVAAAVRPEALALAAPQFASPASGSEIVTRSGDAVAVLSSPAASPADGDFEEVVEPLFGGQMFLVLRVARDEIVSAGRAAVAFGIAAPVLISVVVLCLAWLALDGMVGAAVVELRRVAARLGAGALGARVDIDPHSPEELVALGQSLNDMASALQRREAALQEALDEQRALLQEVCHRVRNNLQVIVSLVSMQMDSVAGEAERAALRDIYDRVQAIALVQGALYDNPAVSRLRLDRLLNDIVGALERARGGGTRPHVFVVQTYDPIEVDAARAVTIALLVTEAINNGLRRIGASGGAPRMAISLKVKSERIELSIMDDAPACRDGSTLSRRLIAALARQLGAALNFETTPRNRITLVIPLAPSANDKSSPTARAERERRSADPAPARRLF